MLISVFSSSFEPVSIESNNKRLFLFGSIGLLTLIGVSNNNTLFLFIFASDTVLSSFLSSFSIVVYFGVISFGSGKVRFSYLGA